MKLKTPKNGKHYTKEEVQQNFVDMIDLFCSFADVFERVNNKPSLEFLSRRMDFLDEEVEELREAIKANDIVEILDGAADVAFIAILQAYYAMLMLGYNEVNARTQTRTCLIKVGITNMTKNIPEKGAGVGAKITKPEGWEAPKIKELISIHDRLKKYLDNIK